MFAKNFTIFFGRIFAQFQTSRTKFICLLFRKKVFDNSKTIHIQLKKKKRKEREKKKCKEKKISNTLKPQIKLSDVNKNKNAPQFKSIELVDIT